MLAYDVKQRNLHIVDRSIRLVDHPVVQASLNSKRSVALLLDNLTDGHGSFNVHEAVEAVDCEPWCETIEGGGQSTVKAMLDAERAAMSTARSQLGYVRWPELLPRTPPTSKRWGKAIDREREAITEARQRVMQESAFAVAANASLRAECDRLLCDVRELSEAVLQKAPEFDERAFLQARLDDLRGQVKSQTDAESDLLRQLDDCHIMRAELAARHSAKTVGPGSDPRSLSNVAQSVPLSGMTWPSFSALDSSVGIPPPLPPVLSEGPEEQARRVAELWGCDVRDLLPEERHLWPTAPSEHESSTFGSGEREGSATHRALLEPIEMRSDLETGISMLPSDLNAQVRHLLQQKPAAGESNTTSSTRSDARVLSSVAMRVLASDLSLYLRSDESDPESRRDLLIRVRELRGKLAHQ